MKRTVLKPHARPRARSAKTGGRHQSSNNLTRNFERPSAGPFIFRPLLYTRGKRAICLKIHVQAVDINLRTRGFLKLKFVRDFMSTTKFWYFSRKCDMSFHITEESRK